MAKKPLNNHNNTEQMKTVLRASERVSSWPEWKRSMTLYRNDGPPSPAIRSQEQLKMTELELAEHKRLRDYAKEQTNEALLAAFAIHEYRTYLRNEEDIEDDGHGGVRPNEAMKHLMELDRLLERHESEPLWLIIRHDAEMNQKVANFAAGIKKFGYHIMGCPAVDSDETEKCDCGFRDALEGGFDALAEYIADQANADDAARTIINNYRNELRQFGFENDTLDAMERDALNRARLEKQLSENRG